MRYGGQARQFELCVTHPLQVVSKEQGQQLADQLGMGFFETSAKSKEGVDEAFYFLTREIKKRLELQSATSKTGTESTVKGLLQRGWG